MCTTGQSIGVGENITLKIARDCTKILHKCVGAQVFDNKAGDCLGVRNIWRHLSHRSGHRNAPFTY